MADASFVAPVAAVISALAAVTTVAINTWKSRQDARKNAAELARKDLELREAATRHREQLEHAKMLHSDQLKQAQYISITQRVFDLDNLFIQHPQLRVYFYEERIVDPGTDVQKITALTEFILDFYSLLQEHEHILASASPSWGEWNTYIEDGFRSSPFLCHYFEQNASWYEDGLAAIYRRVAKDRQELLKRQRAALPA